MATPRDECEQPFIVARRPVFGATGVRFGPNDATFTVRSKTRITAVAPARQPGTVGVMVIATGGTSAATAS
jgi:hypothetical protein